MKILYITPFPIINSGSGSYVLQLADFFSSHGHNVVIVNIDNDKKKYEKNYNIITIPFKKPIIDIEFPCFTTHPNTNNKFYTMTDTHIKLYVNYLKEIYQGILNTYKPDIIHSQYLWINSAIIGELKENIPLITTSFGNEVHTMNEDIRYKKYVEQSVSSSDYIIALSKQIENILKTTFSLDRAKLRLIYKGYDDEIFNYIDSKEKIYRDYFGLKDTCKHIVLFYDNLSQMKGIDIFLKSAMEILKTRKDFCFIIVGKGEYDNQVKELSQNNREHFLYYESLSIEEKSFIHYISEMKIMPVKFEKFGVNALESLAMGTPVIASDVGELSYFINDNTGIVLKNPDVDNLKKAIINFTENKLKEKLSFFCYQYAQRNYSKSASLKLINKLYMHALQ